MVSPFEAPAERRLVPFVCECHSAECVVPVLISLFEYEALRGDDDHRLIAPGHEIEGEQVVVETPTYAVTRLAEPGESGWRSRSSVSLQSIAGQAQSSTSDDLGPLRDVGVRQSWSRGDILMRQGERPSLLFLIELGEVSLWATAGGERSLVQIVHVGETVGAVSVLLDEECPFTSVARERTLTLGFDRERIHNLLERDREICFVWLRLLSRQVKLAYTRNVALAGRSAIERLMVFLAHEFQAKNSSSLLLTQSEVASATGLSRQRVSQLLGLLEDLGLLEQGRGSLHLLERGREAFGRKQADGVQRNRLLAPVPEPGAGAVPCRDRRPRPR